MSPARPPSSRPSTPCPGLHAAEPTDPILSLAWSDDDGPARAIIVLGELDMSNAHLLVELAEGHLAATAPGLVLDLSRTTFLDVHGVTALLRIRDLVHRAGGRCTLRRPGRWVTRLLTLTGGADRFDIERGRPAALPG